MNRKTVIGICSLIAVIAAVLLVRLFSSPAAPVLDEQAKAAIKEKDQETQRLVSKAQIAINVCASYVNAYKSGENEHLTAARHALRRFAQDPENNSIDRVDCEIRDAYLMARKPVVIAELQQTIAEQTAYLSHVLERNDVVNTRGWTHLKQAQEFLNQYASGGHEGLPILIRQESAYVKQLMDDGVAKAPTKLIGALDELIAVEKVGGEPKPNLRLYAHTKQARRFYDAFVKSSATNHKLLTLALAECMYARKLNVEADYVIGKVEDGKDDVVCGDRCLSSKDYAFVAPFLQAVDSLVTKIEIVEASFPESKEANEALTKVRKTFDWAVSQMTKRNSLSEHYWVEDSLRDVDAVIEKLREQAGPRKLEVPLQANFQRWLDEYLKKNDSSWLRGQSCEFWLVPQAYVGTVITTQLIGGREHCYLNLTFKGLSVLAVTKETK